MNTAVVFFSLQGNSALAARALADKLGARLVELKETQAREFPSGFAKAGFQAFFGISSKLAGQPWNDVNDCSELHIVSPVWATKTTPALNRFLSKCDFSGKSVTIYSVQADPAANAVSAREKIARAVRRKGGTVKAMHGLMGAAPGKGVNEDLADKIKSL